MVLTEYFYHCKASMLCSSATHPATMLVFSCTFLSQIKGFRDYFFNHFNLEEKERKRKRNKGALMLVPASCKEWALRNIIGED